MSLLIHLCLALAAVWLACPCTAQAALPLQELEEKALQGDPGAQYGMGVL
ncbi:MAG TPA: hypothetical protein IAB01_03245, partial [Candidatus Avidesulfovibrio excrementigallinarum]|nr:hypothetical protein [Candidatus Avidesulfovibrio excrementigallinarum]